MDRIDILAVSTSYPMDAQSTSGIFVARLLQAMPENYRVKVLTPASTKKDYSKSNSGIEVHTFRYAPVSWQILAHQPGGIPVALQRKPWLRLIVPVFLLCMFVALFRLAKHAQVVHANWSVCGFIAGFVGRLRGIPVLTTLRGEDLNRARTSWFHDLMVRSTLRNSRQIVTVSNAFEECISKEYPEFRHKCRTISNGVAEEFIRVGATRIDSTAKIGPPVRIVSVGSLIPRKGMDVILNAVASLKKSGNIRLTIVGDGAEKDSLQALAERLGIDEEVEFVGKKTPAEIPMILNLNDVFVLASHSEGRPNVVLEAKAAGLAVVASSIDGVREIIGNDVDGLLFNDGAADQLASHLQHLLNKPSDIRRIGKRAHLNIVEKNLTWRHSADQYVELYRELVAAGYQ